MKQRTLPLIIIWLTGCLVHTSSFAMNWFQKSNFTPGNRSGGFAFSIGQKGYVGSGVVQNGTALNLVNDLWEYDKTLDLWTQKATLPSGGRVSAATFTALNNGYVTTGFDLVNYLNDTWQYDPLSNIWQPVAAFPGSPRYTCASFDVSDYGFVGMGKSGGYYSDFYRYNPTTDTWTALAPVPGTARQSAKGFSINDYGYVVGGANEGSGYNCKELWRYDPIGDVWVQKSDYPGNGSYAFAAFVFGNDGYVGTGAVLGTGPNIVYDDFYSYNPVTDTWSPIPNFGGGIRAGAISMTIGNSGFAGMGSTEIYPLLNYQDDWWTFQDLTGLEEPHHTTNDVTAYFNGNLDLVFQLSQPAQSKMAIHIFDSSGKRIHDDVIFVNQQKIVISNLHPATGIYYYSIIGLLSKPVSGKAMFLH